MQEPIIASGDRSPSPCPSDLPENQQLDDNQVENEIDEDAEFNEECEDDWEISSESDGDSLKKSGLIRVMMKMTRKRTKNG